MKAIETRYKGYRFRSRLEARWAVFLDAMGADWDYEPQGYDLGAGVLYLPDFRLRSGEFLEIKPLSERENDHERRKWVRLAEQSGQGVFVVFGQPGDADSGTAGIMTGGGLWLDPVGTPPVERAFVFLQCRGCGAFAYAAPDGSAGGTIGCATACRTQRQPAAGNRIAGAVRAARGARFEHGESDFVQPALPMEAPRARVYESPEERQIAERMNEINAVFPYSDNDTRDRLMTEKRDLLERMQTIQRGRWKRL